MRFNGCLVFGRSCGWLALCGAKGMCVASARACRVICRRSVIEELKGIKRVHPVAQILRPVGATMGDDPQKVRFLLKSTNIPCILMSIAQPPQVVEEYKFMLEKSQSFFAGLR